MNIYCEFLLERIRIKINGDEIAFQLSSDFYSNTILKNSLVGERIKGYVDYNKPDLTFFEIIAYPFTLNKVYILVNQEVQDILTVRTIHDFAVKFMEAKVVYIIPKPSSFDSTVLEDVHNIRTEYINSRNHGNTAIAKLRTATPSGAA
ncbi:MAG: hypothetical protein WKF87_11155 [Chryseolinea sp.]